MKPIPVFDYLTQFRALQPELLDALRRVLESGRLILGPEVEAFEREFAAFLGASAAGAPMHAVGVANGTDAIALLLRGLGVGSGDEVVTVANTAVPTVSAIREAGATPVFCDVDPDTCLIDLERLPACLTARTKVVVAVHLFGNAVDVPRLRELVQGRGIRVVEDCAQSHGARCGGRMTGTMGDASAFSFYPTKNLGAYGDGGLCATGDPALAARLRSLRMYGFESHYYAEREGVNSRLDELQAAILRVKLRYLPDSLRRRRELAAIYAAELPHSARPVLVPDGVQHAYYLYVVRVPERDRIRAALAQSGIGTGIHYPFPIHLMRAYEFLGRRAGDLPVTERLAGEVLSLPMYPELSPDDARRVCACLRDLLS